MASIKCGHCPDTHDSVDMVRECWEIESQPVEICCKSCDGLITYMDHYPEPGTFPEYCGGQWCKVFPPM